MCGMHPISRGILGEQGCLLLVSGCVLRDQTVPKHPEINSDCAFAEYEVWVSSDEAPGNAVGVDARLVPFATLPSTV